MDPRVVARNFLASSASENEQLVNVKRATMQTPRAPKLPFGDTTNKASDSLKSAKKNLIVSDNLKIKRSVTASLQSPKEEIEKVDFNELDQWAFPEDKNCYCCGDNRKTDGEVWGKQLAATEEFIDKLSAVSLYEEDCVTPLVLSPIKLALMEPTAFSFEIPPFNIEDYCDGLPSRLECVADAKYEDSAMELHVDSSIESLNSSLVFNLSLEDQQSHEDDSMLDSSLTVPSDDSIIEDW